jgi:cell division protein FtsI/penicillin-binding protein 2
MRLLRQAMVGVVEAQNGTGKLARIAGMEVAGKTGTAQNPHGEDHSCFIAYAPADDPTIAIAVIAENAGGGGAVAAPMAREVMRTYLRIEDPEEEAPAVPALTQFLTDEGEPGGGTDAGP